jgi:hypothetical protein
MSPRTATDGIGGVVAAGADGRGEHASSASTIRRT